MWKEYHSKLDESVNFVKNKENGLLETRYVRRDNYVICYLSSHNGCNKSCRFCHLTATKQTYMTDTTIQEFIEQSTQVLKYYSNMAPVSKIHYNWMATGEPFANKAMVTNFSMVRRHLQNLATEFGLESKFNISTIMPEGMPDLYHIVGDLPVEIYYSMYSLNPKFRKRWIPKAMDPFEALKTLKAYQDITGNRIAFHWTFIEGQNDDLFTVNRIAKTLKEYDFDAKFNLVRYNPYSEKQGQESSDEVLQRNFDILRDALNNDQSKIVTRVGYDVKASCGRFME